MPHSVAALLLLLSPLSTSRLSGQLPGSSGAGGRTPPQHAVQSTRAAEEALAEARTAQTRFERQRRQWSPVRSHPWLSGDCDELVGRICLRYDEGGDWWPEPEDPRILEARLTLLATLEDAAHLRPSDSWILGQRVLYLGEAGRWGEGESLARACASETPEWCAELLGLALHAQARFPESEAAFGTAVGLMEEGRRRKWTDPSVLLDDEGRRHLRDAGAEGSAQRARALERLWRLADPLYLVAGNDRLTEHWSRLTVARLREGVVNPYAMSWGRDLEEVLIRYGWEVGWDRTIDSRGTGSGVVGHHHPEIRRYIPPGRILADPASARRDDWPLSLSRPRDGYAPSYAPVIIPADAELLRFPRGARSVVVSLYAVPTDTTHHAPHRHAPFQPASGGEAQPVLSGLFLLPLEGGEPLEVRRSGAAEGALLLDAPPGDYLASAEVWVPERGFAGRTREALHLPAPSPAPTLSDLMLLARALPDSATLVDAVQVARRAGPIGPGEDLVIGWEVYAAAAAAEQLSYRLSLARTDRALLKRVGDWLGLSRPDDPLRLVWEEPAASATGPTFRAVSIQIPELDSGDYLLRVELTAAGAPPVSSERVLRVDRR